MQSDKSSPDSSFSRDPRSIPPRRISHYTTSGQSNRSQSKDSDTGKTKRKDADDEDSDLEQYNFEKLKNFQIPRKKGRGEKELLNEIPLTSREYTHKIYQTLRSSFFDPQSSKKMIISQAEVVHNDKLEKEYLAKKKDMKDEGRSEKDLTDSFGYLHFFKRSEVEKVCKDGVSVGHCNLTSLGKPDMGVYISKHADIVRFSKWEDDNTGYIVMFKIIRGKTKLVGECRTQTTEQEPTPLYDCHITKLPIDIAQSVHSRAYQAMQYYFYEYGEIDVVQRPRQVLPYAVLKYTYRDIGSMGVAASRTSRRESSHEELISEHGNSVTSPAILSMSDSGFCHWRGMLLVKNGTFCPVEMRSHLDTVFNVANIDRNINIKTCLPLDRLKRQLPPTLLSRSAKKYNVIYRGRHYNTFTLHPTEEGSGLGKFRQLISHLVQRSAAAFIPLRNNSSLHLLPISGLTEEMGLRNSSPELMATSESTKQSQRAWKNFLHVIVITPKALSSKINDQRVHNIIHTRKRKDSNSTAAMSSVRDALEQKLRQMNIDPSLGLSTMDAEQQQKIFDRIKDKKKVQTSEKMLHHHYKEVDSTSSSVKAEWRKKLREKWSSTARLQQEIYLGKKKSKVTSSPGGAMKPTYSRSATENSVEASFDDNTEATFSDDDDTTSKQPPTSTYKIPKRGRTDDYNRAPRSSSYDSRTPSIMHRPDPRMESSNKAKSISALPLPPVVKPKSSVSGASSSSIFRPSFKPLEELIFAENLEELMKHPEFSFTEKHCSTHKVSGFSSSFHVDGPYIPWEEKKPRISITFSQLTPYEVHNTDCPYAFEGDQIILAMLHAIHGDYDGTEDKPEDHEKVNWVRKILHNREPVPDINDPSSSSSKRPQEITRKIVEHVDNKTSPKFVGASPHMSSTDSGFVSSSAACTPGDIPIPDSPSFKDIAAIIASALTQTKAVESAAPKETVPAPKPQESDPDMDLAAKALLEALVQPKSSDNDVNSEVQGDDLEGVDMEIGTPPDDSIVRERSWSREAGQSPNRQTGEALKSPLLAAPRNAQGPDSMCSSSWERPITPPPVPPSFSGTDGEDAARRRNFESFAESDSQPHQRRSSDCSHSRSSLHFENNVQNESWYQENEHWSYEKQSNQHSYTEKRNGESHDQGHYWSQPSEDGYHFDDWEDQKTHGRRDTRHTKRESRRNERGSEHHESESGHGERYSRHSERGSRRSESERGYDEHWDFENNDRDCEYSRPRLSPRSEHRKAAPRRDHGEEFYGDSQAEWDPDHKWAPKIRPPRGIRRPALLGNRPSDEDNDNYTGEAPHPTRKRPLLGKAPLEYEDSTSEYYRNDHRPEIPHKRRVLLEEPQSHLYRHNHHPANHRRPSAQRGRPRPPISHQAQPRPRALLPRPSSWPRPPLHARPRPPVPRPRREEGWR